MTTHAIIAAFVQLPTVAQAFVALTLTVWIAVLVALWRIRKRERGG